METALQMREIWALWSRRGVLYLKPYLTAWINSSLFRCWAGAHPLLVLSFNNHAGFLSSLQCTVSYTGITNPGSTVRVRAQWTIILLAWLGCLQFGYVSEYMSSPIHLFIFWNILQISIATVSILPGPLVYQKKVFLKQKSITVSWELSIHTSKKCEM